MIARAVAHGVLDRGIADQEPGDRHGKRATDVQVFGQRIAAHDERQGDQNLEVVLVDRLHQSEAEQPEAETEEHAAARLGQEQLHGVAERRMLAAGGGAEQDREQDDADAVIEQALAGDLGLECGRHARRFQDAEHEAVIDVAENGREDDQHGGDFEGGQLRGGQRDAPFRLLGRVGRSMTDRCGVPKLAARRGRPAG